MKENKIEMTFRRAFTLAEVLITLTIIGVIAALTIPNLMQRWQDHADVVKVKKIHSIFDNALKMAVAENGRMDEWGWPNPDGSFDRENDKYLNDIMVKYLKVQRYCNETSSVNKCFDVPGLYFKNLDGTKSAYFIGGNDVTILLQDGTSVRIGSGDPKNMSNTGNNGTFNATVTFDINGAQKGPNKYGYDVFAAYIHKDGRLDKSLSYTKPENCSLTTGKGDSCFEWIRKHGNMDYKYRDVSAEW